MGMEVSEDAPTGGCITEEEMLAVARSWILHALSSASQSDGGHYRKMMMDLRGFKLEDPTSVAALQLRLRVLSQSVSFISERYHQALLDHVLGMSVWIYSAGVVDALLEFVVNLATANGGCVGQCLDMLVRNFLPPSCGLPPFLDTHNRLGLMGGWNSMEKIRAQRSEHMARKNDVLNRLHHAIQQVSVLVPTSPLRMQPIVFKRMPHRASAKEWNVLYLENMLRLDSFGDKYVASQMLPAVIDQLIKIDVEIRWEDILTEEETGKVYMFHMDLEEDGEEREADENEAGHPAGPGIEAKIQHGLMGRPSKQQAPTLDEMADKMDLMMDMTLQHLQDCARKGQSQQVYDTLIKSFQSTILNTHKSKFTQFLIFFLCSLAPNTCGNRFAYLLCDIFTSRTRPTSTRMSAAAYLASYLARAKYLPLDVISTTLKRVVHWCVGYGANEVVKPASNVPDSVVHGVFFSACQAVMYTLCFRFKTLMDDPEGKRFLRGLPLQQFVEHRLHPLKVCLPSVVEEFLKQASTLQLVEQKHWLISKEQLHLNSGAVMVGDVRLDMFFPFDPYLLRHSDRFIRPNFTYWSMVEALDENGISDTKEDFDDAESNISSDSETEHEYAQSFDSYRDDDSADEYERILSKSDIESVAKSDPTMRFQDSLEGTSPYSDDGFVHSFQNSFDSMAITPPQTQKMPAKLPPVLPPAFHIEL